MVNRYNYKMYILTLQYNTVQYNKVHYNNNK